MQYHTWSIDLSLQIAGLCHTSIPLVDTITLAPLCALVNILFGCNVPETYIHVAGSSSKLFSHIADCEANAVWRHEIKKLVCIMCIYSMHEKW